MPKCWHVIAFIPYSHHPSGTEAGARDSSRASEKEKLVASNLVYLKNYFSVAMYVRENLV